MLSDLRNAIRALRAAPGFTAVALVVLTLGIGATTAIFSVVDAVVLRSLPFSDADRLIAVGELAKKAGGPALSAGVTGVQSVAAPNFLDWKTQQSVFEGLAASAGGRGFTIREGGQPEDLRVARVTANLFSILRVAPRLGHTFSAVNEVDGNHRVAILSDGLWRRRFGADPNVVGKTMTFDTGVWEIAGVMPPGFTYPLSSEQPTEMWVPYVVPEREKVRGDIRIYYLQVVGRLKPDATIEQARAQMEQITAGLAQAFPKWFADRGVSVRTLHSAIVGGSVRSWMLMLLGAVAFVLLIACVNVATLMLARATARSREMRIRAALGARRWQLARGVIIESLVLSIAGTVCGVVMALWGVSVLRAALPASLPRISSVGIDLRVLLAAAIAAITTGVAFGLAPALQLSRPNVAGALREGGRSNTAGVARQRLRTMLVVAEVGLAVVLLAGSGLFISSFVRLMRIDIGLDYHNVLTVPVYPRIDFNNRDAEMKRAGVLVADILDRVRGVPGIEMASALSNGLPLSGSWSRTSVKVPGRAAKFEGDDAVDVRLASPGYLKAVRVPLLKGRWIEENDRGASAAVVVINDEAARRYFSGRDPIGAAVGIDGDRTVIGVVSGIRLGGPESVVRPEAYVPLSQGGVAGADLVLRTSQDPLTLVPAVKAAIWSVAPDLVIREADTFEGMLGTLVAQRKFNMLLLGLFGVLAMAITAAGIYGVMAYVVSQQTQEIGVRMALGARPATVLGMVLGRAALYVAAGLAIGLAGSWVLARSVATFLFQVEPHDPIVYVGTAVTLMLVGLVAGFVPAWRASRVDPLIALRAE